MARFNGPLPLETTTLAERADLYLRYSMGLFASDLDQRQNQTLRHLVQFADRERRLIRKAIATHVKTILWSHRDVLHLREAAEAIDATTKAPRVRKVATRAKAKAKAKASR